jgi:glycosyltransferase involved in cell wall biosynthesis
MPFGRSPQRPRLTIFVIGSARLGGAESQMTRLACELRFRGEDVRMLFLVYGGPLTAQLDAAGVPWEVMRRDDWPPSSTLRNVYGLSRLWWRLVRLRPDVVCAWLAGAVWPTMLFARPFTPAKRVVGFRGEVFAKDLRWQASLFRRAVRHAHVVTVNSPSLAIEAANWGADPTRVRFLPNGVDLPTIQADVLPTPPRAVVVANFRWYKGHDTLIDALALVATRLEVRLCGEGAARADFISRVSDLNLDERVVFVDEPADVQAELKAAQFAIHPSRTEGLSNAILEEMSFGLPVVATNVGGTYLLVEDGITGRLVEAGDVANLAKAIEEVASDADLRLQMSTQVLRRVADFDWETCVDRYAEMLDRLCPAGGRP